MIYITGDTHSDVKRLSVESFPEQKDMTKDDYVIILGDFGLVWNKDKESEYEEFWLDWLENKPFTTLFVCGNHENYDRLNNYPVNNWHNGKVQFIRPSVIHLCRGEVFDIDGLKILAMGGAASHDIKDGILEIGDERIKEWEKDYYKLFRINHLSWWKEEIPSEKERLNAINNLTKCDNSVDFILSHEAPASDVCLLGNGYYKPDEYSMWLENIRQTIDYKKWFFGHYHTNKAINNKEFALFEQIIRVN